MGSVTQLASTVTGPPQAQSVFANVAVQAPSVTGTVVVIEAAGIEAVAQVKVTWTSAHSVAAPVTVTVGGAPMAVGGSIVIVQATGPSLADVPAHPVARRR
jgi:hypothetical protein